MILGLIAFVILAHPIMVYFTVGRYRRPMNPQPYNDD